jgi:hypothetical protein
MGKSSQLGRLTPTTPYPYPPGPSLYPYPPSWTATNPYGAGYNPYGPGSYDSESPVAGMMRGTASMITAQGQFLINLQQAALAKDQSIQAAADTRKKVFDEFVYERKNAPSPEDHRQRDLAGDLERSLNNPPAAEILSGHALNAIIRDLAGRISTQGDAGRSTPALDEDVLRHINVVRGSSGNPGLLKDKGKLAWPVALRHADYQQKRMQLDSLAPDAVRQAMTGRIDVGILAAMRNALAGLREGLNFDIRKIAANEYVEASRFLNCFEEAIKLLERPDAGEAFAQCVFGKNATIAGLVKTMVSKGLTFTSAVPGDEGAYLALYRELVGYHASTKPELTARQ